MSIQTSTELKAPVYLNEFCHSDGPQPHPQRTRQILSAHPELKQLFGREPWTVAWSIAIVALQTALAVALSDSPWWMVLGVAFLVGAVANHALFILVHDICHNLALKGTTPNRILGIFTNFPLVFPSFISFQKFHLLHHRHQGELEFDADLASPWEARWVGNSPLRKTLWFLFFFIVEGVIRPARLKRVKLVDGWTVVNVVAQFAYMGVLVAFAGWGALLYQFLSSCFGIGLHPLGARWIQEHYIFREGQETYSYYGPWNRLSFNVGHHNEHHDLVMVPWSRLPKVRAMAPEFYNGLYYHMSYTRLLLRFIFDRNLTLFSRAIRPSRVGTFEKFERASAGQLQEELAKAPIPEPVA